MATAALSPIAEKFIDKLDPDDPDYQRDLIRPVEIKEDVKLMEQRKRVSVILKSKKFRKELEDVMKRQWRNHEIPDSVVSTLSVNYISERILLAALPRQTASAIGVGVSTNGIVPINDLRGVSPYGRKEHQLRCKVAAIHRLTDMFSWCNSVQNYITARISKDQDRFLIKPFGIFFHEVTASSLITVDSKGAVKDPGSSVLPPDDSNWLLQSALHSYRPDICCLIHLRTPSALNVSSTKKGLIPISSEAILLGEIAMFDSLSDLNSPTVFNSFRNELCEVLGQRNILVLVNNGIFILGKTVEEAWFLAQRVQTACEVQESLFKLDDDDLVFSDPSNTHSNILQFWQGNSLDNSADENGNVKKGTPENFLQLYRLGEIEFEALMRHLDNSGYRTGYLYRNRDVYKTGCDENGKSPLSKYPDVEIPPVCSSLAHNIAQYDEGGGYSGDEMDYQKRRLKRGVSDSAVKAWFNTPNTYKLDDAFDFESSLIKESKKPLTSLTPEHRKPRWISANLPDKTATKAHHPVTPGAHVVILSSSAISAPATPAKVPLKGIDPKELKEKQKKVKSRYYHDTNTPGPQSTLLDGVTWDEARRLREEGLTRFLGTRAVSDDEPLVTAASKGIVQRGHKDRAVVLEGVFKPANPFEKVTDDDLVRYREEIDRKNHPELYLQCELVTSKSETELISPSKAEAEMLVPQFTSLSQDMVYPKQIDTGMTSDSDYPGDSSVAITSHVANTSGGGGGTATLTSETSAAEISHDDTEKEGRSPKEKKKKKLFKNIFAKKKKK